MRAENSWPRWGRLAFRIDGFHIIFLQHPSTSELERLHHITSYKYSGKTHLRRKHHGAWILTFNLIFNEKDLNITNIRKSLNCPGSSAMKYVAAGTYLPWFFSYPCTIRRRSFPPRTRLLAGSSQGCFPALPTQSMCTLQCFTSRMVKCRVTGRQNNHSRISRYR